MPSPLPIALELGFDFWLICVLQNGSYSDPMTQPTGGQTFHYLILCRPGTPCPKTGGNRLGWFRGNTVLTFDTETRGAVVIERLDELNESIQRWLEKNSPFIDFVIPIENSLTRDPVQAMFCGTIARMQRALAALAASGLEGDITVLRTEYPARDLSMLDVLNRGCSKGHALERWARHRGVPREQVMAIGDNYNDIEMLAFAGRPFIMGNASPELRRKGWALTLPNDQNGVAAAIAQVLELDARPG